MPSKTETPAVILGIDSAMNGCGAAIYFVEEPERNISVMLPMLRGQAEALVPLIKDVVSQAGIVFSDIDLIMTTRGPGTFTGLRVGLSAARNFALALDVPLLGVSTLEVLARGYLDRQIDDAEAVAVIIESKRSDFYFQLFDRSAAALIEAGALEPSNILQALQSHTGVIIGDAQSRFKESCHGVIPAGFCMTGSEDVQPDPLVLARMGLDTAVRGGKYKDISPIYLRGAEVSLPKKRQRHLKQ